MDFQSVLDFFGNLFKGYSHEDTTVFGIFTLLSFILGFIISALAKNRRIKKLRKELADARNEATNAKVEYAAMKEQFELKTADLQKAELEIADYKNRLEILEAEKRQLHTDLYNTNEEIEKLNASSLSYSSTIDDLNNQIIGLKSKSGEYSEGLGEGIENLDSETVKQISQMHNSYNATLNRLVALEEKLNHLDVENEVLKAELDNIKKSTKLAATAATPVILTSTQDTNNQEEIKAEVKTDELLLALQEKVKAAVGNSIPSANGRKDDLTLIDGVGPFIEQKLNDLGIFTYEQISSFDEDIIEQVTEAIEFFPGRIQKDDWVGQATKLMGGTINKKEDESTDSDKNGDDDVNISMAKSIPAPFRIELLTEENPYKDREDDLKIIEGIGPKISELLLNAGVNTWHKLADASIEDLKKILSDGGNRFKMHDPTSWPQQAHFAANRNWKKLKEYQDYLIGGRDVAK